MMSIPTSKVLLAIGRGSRSMMTRPLGPTNTCARVFSVSSAGECPKGMISYRNDNGTWVNAAEDHALALATPAHSPGWGVAMTPCVALEDW